MSETEYHRGKVIEIKQLEGEDIQETAKRILSELNIEMKDYYDNYLDCLQNEAYEGVVFANDKLYRVVDDIKIDIDTDIFRAEENSDGSISYEVKYYNGGCGFNEAIEEALENCQDN